MFEKEQKKLESDQGTLPNVIELRHNSLNLQVIMFLKNVIIGLQLLPIYRGDKQ